MDSLTKSAITAEYVWQRERAIALQATAARAIAHSEQMLVECLVRPRVLRDVRPRPGYGSRVLEINGLFIGTLQSVNPCCIEVAGPDRRFTVRFEGLFVVSDRQVEIICNSAEVHRYVCLLHEPAPKAESMAPDV